MSFAEGSEPVLNSIVLVLESSNLALTSVSDLEKKLGNVVEVRERMVGSEGTLQVLGIPKKHLEVLLSPTRWQFSLQGEVVSEDTAKYVAETITVLSEHVDNPHWKAIGYNYNSVLTALGGKSAIEAISEKTVNLKQLSERLGYQVNGNAVWLYLNVKGKDAWLRLEPRGGDRKSPLVWAYANFDQKLDGHLPAETQLAADFVQLGNVFLNLIGKL
jgi:hypothetical protein